MLAWPGALDPQAMAWRCVSLSLSLHQPGGPGEGHLTPYRFPGNLLAVSPSGTYRPDYTIKQYSEQVYKIIRFKRSFSDDGFIPERKADKSLQEDNAQKLANNFSRARSMLLQYALCNRWEYFFTGTINAEWFDRFDLSRYYIALSQWIRDKRKEYGTEIKYLLVPERHKDGAWHIHGLLSGLPGDKLFSFVPGLHPRKLVDSDYLNWGDYAQKFGFCSLGKVQDPIGSAFYICKYLSKDASGRLYDLGQHLYYHSRGLATAQPVAYAYGVEPALDRYITHEYEFCAVGMVTHDVDWKFPLDYEPAFGGSVAFIDLGGDLAGAVPLDVPQACEAWEQLSLFVTQSAAPAPLGLKQVCVT